MQAVDAEVDGGAFARFDDLVFELFLHLRDNLFDARGVDAAVGNELMQREAAGFAADGVEGGDDDCFGRVVDHDFHSAGSFERANVSSFAPDDAAFHLVVVDVEDGDGVLDGRFRCYALDGLDDDFFRLLIGVELGLVHNLVDVALCVGPRLVFERFDEPLLEFFGVQARQFFEFLALANLHFVELLLLGDYLFALVVKQLLVALHVLPAPRQFVLFLVEREFALLETVFVLQNFLAALLHLFLQF